MKNIFLSLLFSFYATALFLPCDMSATGDNDQTENALKNQNNSPRNHDQSKTLPNLVIDTTVQTVVAKASQPNLCPETPTSPSNPYYKPALCCAAHTAVRSSRS